MWNSVMLEVGNVGHCLGCFVFQNYQVRISKTGQMANLSQEWGFGDGCISCMVWDSSTAGPMEATVASSRKQSLWGNHVWASVISTFYWHFSIFRHCLWWLRCREHALKHNQPASHWLPVQHQGLFLFLKSLSSGIALVSWKLVLH
jgi:hypothetical protein